MPFVSLRTEATFWNIIFTLHWGGYGLQLWCSLCCATNLLSVGVTEMFIISVVGVQKITPWLVWPVSILLCRHQTENCLYQQAISRAVDKVSPNVTPSG